MQNVKNINDTVDFEDKFGILSLMRAARLKAEFNNRIEKWNAIFIEADPYDLISEMFWNAELECQ